MDKGRGDEQLVQMAGAEEEVEFGYNPVIFVALLAEGAVVFEDVKLRPVEFE